MSAMSAQDPAEADEALAPRPSSPQHTALTRWLLLALALLSLGLGILGIFLPVLPTVPFILLAAWAASKSSPRLSHWLENHRWFRQHLKDWRRSGTVRRPAKWAATVTMTVSGAATLWLLRANMTSLLVVAMMACVLAWLWKRPEQGKE